MTPNEQAQVQQIYKEFEKLAHLMDDWAKEFDADMSKFDEPKTAAKTNKPVSTPAASVKGGRQDTGSRTQSGWRQLQEGTNRYQYDATTVDGERNYGIDRFDSYVHVGGSAYPEDPRTPTIMDNVVPPRPQQTVQAPSRPPPVLPTIIDMTKDVKRPRAPETKELALTPKPVPQPETPTVYSIIPNSKPAQQQQPQAPAATNQYRLPKPAPAPEPKLAQGYSRTAPVSAPVYTAPYWGGW